MQRFKRQIESFTLTFVNQNPTLKIVARKPSDNFVLEATLTNGQLPNTCINLFDNVEELYNYVKKCESSHITITSNMLKINVIAFKLREVTIPLEVRPISREEILEKKVEHLESYTLDLEKRVSQLERIVKIIKSTEKKTAIPVKETKEVKNVKDLKKPKETGQMVSQQQQQQLLDFNSASTKVLTPPLLSPFSKLNSDVFNPFAPKKFRPPSIPFPFQIDQTTKFIQCFTVYKNTITLNREDDEIYMLSSTSPIPSTKRHSVSFRVNKITDGLIWIGLMIESKKADQYIGEQGGIMMFALDGKRILIESNPHKMQLPEFKAGNIIRMQVDISERKFRLYRDEKRQAFIKLTIPQSLAKQKLYPFVQFISKDDSATIL